MDAKMTLGRLLRMLFFCSLVAAPLPLQFGCGDGGQDVNQAEDETENPTDVDSTNIDE